MGGLTLGTDGNLYGTTTSGGATNHGTIFKITSSGNLTRLHSFGKHGSSPQAAPIEGADGNFYGTTSAGGTAYKITPLGTFTLLASLPGPSAAPLVQGTDGNFYGTTAANGGGEGTVFNVTPKGVVAILYTFDGTNGAYPYSPVIQGSDGNFYGTTYEGGSNGDGIVFRITPLGAMTVLHNFPDPNNPSDGTYPAEGLVQATDGNFYGPTDSGGATDVGVIFQITPDGVYSLLYNFVFDTGASPASTAMQHTNGEIYGLARWGTFVDGVFYSFDLGLGPFVRLVSTVGKVGNTIGILGQGFTGTTAVSFNRTAASFTVVSDTYLTATVPSGTTTGFVTVTTPSGILTSNQEFRIVK